MVQIHNLPAKRRGVLAEVLGESLGKGLGEFGNAYFANKALEGVMNDPSLKNASSSERMSRLESALRPHGELGEGVFKKHLQIELLADQEKKRKMAIQQQQAENQAFQAHGINLNGVSDPQLRKTLVGQALKQREQESLMKSLFGESSQSQEQEGGMDDQQMQRPVPMGPPSNLNPQQGFQPRGIMQPMQNPQEALQQAPPMPTQITPKKQQSYAERFPPQVLAALAVKSPPLAAQIQRSIDFEQRQQQNSPEVIRDKQIAKAQSSADVKYNQTLAETSKQHELKEKSLSNLEKLNRQGVTGKPYEKLLEKMGLVNLTSEGRREFAADVKHLITDIRSILGGQFSNFEFSTILNAYPSADFSKEANNAIIKNLKDFQDIKTQEVKIAERLKKENGGEIPYDFQSKVNEGVRQYAQSKMASIKENTSKIMHDQYGIPDDMVLMLDPNGEPLSVKPGDVERYKALGAQIP